MSSSGESSPDPYAKEDLLLSQYHDLLINNVDNIDIPANGDDEKNLQPSVMGASHWSSREKARFFAGLDKYGPHDLPAIAKTVMSKSIPEIRQYIMLLQEGLHGLDEHESKAHRTPRFVQVSAAHEIGQECEDALDELALQAEQRTHQRACWRERMKFGDNWILDSRRSLLIEKQVKRQLNGGENNDSEEQPSESEDDGDDGPLPPSLLLLRPLKFLALSYNVFMNGNNEPTARYDRLPIRSEDADGPAIFRSAFEAIYEACVSYTQRIVQAAHFQALTRLRAMPSSSAALGVRKDDVHVALDVLGINKPDPAAYWRRTLPKYDVVVYSNAEQYNDGRDFTRMLGGILRRREVITELEKLTTSHDHPDRGQYAESADSRSEDSDGAGFAWNKPTSRQTETTEEERDDNDDLIELDAEEIYEVMRHEYLESIDLVAAQEEENELRTIVDLPPRQVLRSAASRPRGDPANSQHVNAWRAGGTFIADWELHGPTQDVLPGHTSAHVPRKRRRSTLVVREKKHRTD